MARNDAERSTGYRYRRRSTEDWEKRANQSGGEFEGIFTDDLPVYRVRDGENHIRPLPPSDEWQDMPDFPGHFGMDVYVHNEVGPNRAAVLCLAKMKGKRCPVCEEGAAIKGDEEEQRKYRASKRVVMLILDRKDKEKGVQIWAAPYTLDRDFAKVAKDRQTGEVYAIDDPYEGYDITFDKEGKGRGTKYTGVQLARRPTSVPDSILEKALQYTIPHLLRWRSYDEVARLLRGGGDEDEPIEPSRSRVEDKHRAAPDDDAEPDPRYRGRQPRYADEQEDIAPQARKPGLGASKDGPAARRAQDDDEDRSRVSRRASPIENDEDEELPPPKRRGRDEEDDELPPLRRRGRDEVEETEDDEEPSPRRRGRDDEDDANASSRKSTAAALRERFKR